MDIPAGTVRHHLIYYSVRNNPQLLNLFHQISFDLDDAMNATFLNVKELAGTSIEEAVRHAGNHLGYRQALEEHLNQMAEKFNKEVRALNIPASGFSDALQKQAFDGVVEKYQRKMLNLQTQIRDKLQRPSPGTDLRLVANTDPLGGTQNAYSRAWEAFFGSLP